MDYKVNLTEKMIGLGEIGSQKFSSGFHVVEFTSLSFLLGFPFLKMLRDSFNKMYIFHKYLLELLLKYNLSLLYTT